MNGWTSKVHAKARWIVLGIALTGALLTVVLSGVPKAQAAPITGGVGYQDMPFGSSTASPTGNKPQSKLWYTQDGTWWGLLYNKDTTTFDIYRFDKTAQSWSNTGIVVDRRNNTKADTLWDGTHLYVATAVVSPTGTDLGAKVLRYSYDQATQSYTLDQGFPASINASGPMEALTLEKDSTGKLWVTFTQPDAQGNNKVYVNHSTDSDSNWGQPFVLPGQDGTTTVSPDDISAVVSYLDPTTNAQSIGVMWSNQVDNAIYFASHADGTADDQWTSPDSTVITGPKSADDHIDLKSLQTDPKGRVFAAIKTSFGDQPSAEPTTPLVYLSVLGLNGSFNNYVFGTVADDHTRPILVIDQQNRNLYMFATAPKAGDVKSACGGAIYYKRTSLDSLTPGSSPFPAGKGTLFIQNDADRINNIASTKQNVNNASDLVAVASSDVSNTAADGTTCSPRTVDTNYYYHNFIDITTPTPPPPPPPPDNTKPTVTKPSPRPRARVLDRTPVISATVKDNVTNLAEANITLIVAGKRVPATKFVYNRVSDRLVYRAPKMTLGKKTVRIVARDASGNVGSGAWYFTIVRRR